MHIGISVSLYNWAIIEIQANILPAKEFWRLFTVFWHLLHILPICPMRAQRENDLISRRSILWTRSSLHHLPTPLANVFAHLVVNGNKLCSRYITPRKAFWAITSSFIVLHGWFNCLNISSIVLTSGLTTSYLWLSITIVTSPPSYLESIQTAQMVIVSHALWSSAHLLFLPQIHPKIWRSKITYRPMTESSQSKKKSWPKQHLHVTWSQLITLIFFVVGVILLGISQSSKFTAGREDIHSLQ